MGIPVLRNSQGVFPTFNRPSSASASQKRPRITPRQTRTSKLRQQLSEIEQNRTNPSITRRGNKRIGSSKQFAKGKKSKKGKRTSRKRGSKKKKRK